jgi:hypothetical protein
VKQFATGQILLPQFQRDYVWKPHKARNLLDSLLHEYPIGGFYLWRPSATGSSIDAKRQKFGVGQVSPEFKGYLIDGQQRLTSLEAAFDIFTGEDRGGLELRCYLDLAATNVERGRNTKFFVSYGGKKAIANRVDSGDSTLLPVSTFLEEMDKRTEREQDEQVQTSLQALGCSRRRIEEAMNRLDAARKMLSQDVPCTTVYDISDQKAVDVFSRLNKGGTPLRQGDVTAAELARGATVNVLKQMREFVGSERTIRLGFGFSFAFRALVVFHRDSAQFASLKADWMDAPGLRGRTLAQSWKAAQAALDQALEFVDVRMGWSRRLLLPSVNSLIVLAAAYDRADRVTPADEACFRRWLCLAALRGVFHGSVETTINRFLRCLKDGRRSVGRALVDALHRDEGRAIRADEFMASSQLWGSAVQVMHAWLTHQGARDWLDSEQTIDVLARTSADKFPGGELTVHHIFPRKALTDLNTEPDAINRPANFALLSRSTNSEFKHKPPDEILNTLTPDQRKLAEVQIFGEAAGDRLRIERFEEFCEWRAQRLAESLNEFIELD